MEIEKMFILIWLLIFPLGFLWLMIIHDMFVKYTHKKR